MFIQKQRSTASKFVVNSYSQMVFYQSIEGDEIQISEWMLDYHRG